MDRPSAQLPQAIQDAQAAQGETMPKKQMPKRVMGNLTVLDIGGILVMFVGVMVGLVIILRSPVINFGKVVKAVGFGGALVVTGSYMLGAEGMEVLTGQKMHIAFPGFPKYGPADNGQVYGQNMLMDPRAKDPHMMHTMYPNPSPWLHPGGMEEAVVNAPVILPGEQSMQRA